MLYNLVLKDDFCGLMQTKGESGVFNKSAIFKQTYRQKALSLHSVIIYLQMTKDINRIKAVLAETGKTNIWLAERLGVNPTTVSKWCTNTCQPDLYTLSKIAELLSVSRRELLRP